MAADLRPAIEALAARLQAEVTEHIYVGGVLAQNVEKPAVQIRVLAKSSPIDKQRPPVWSLSVEAVVYGEPEEDESDLLEWAELIEAALERGDRADEPAGQWWTTLGGVVRWAAPDGTVQFRDGGATGTASLSFPIRIEAVPTK